ncbi:MAG: class II aldolase/adducin family protein [Deltaproteobacteria bacterium]|nr:class II aldolase/adducin family protein [Deltaproteobacteria bacterium]
MPSRAQLAAQIVRASHALHARAWVANHDGNVSVRLTDDQLMVTPTATGKGDVTEAGLAITCMEGKRVEGQAKPPSEFLLHVFGCYRVRDDVHAVVHAHPPHATALACAGIPIRVFLAEAVVSIGADIPLTRLAPPSGKAGAEPIAELIGSYDALLLAQHGVITVGRDVEQAMLRMELVEHLARIWTLAQPLGGVKALPDDMVDAMLAKRRSAAGILGAAAAKAGRPAESQPTPDSSSASPAAHAPPSPPAPRAWIPAGPAPAPDAWSGGKTEGACSVVYGAGDASSDSLTDALKSSVEAEIARHLSGK